MNTAIMIGMLNEIGVLFDNDTNREQAARDVRNHVRSYRESRMRAQLLQYFEQRQGRA